MPGRRIVVQLLSVVIHLPNVVVRLLNVVIHLPNVVVQLLIVVFHLLIVVVQFLNVVIHLLNVVVQSMNRVTPVPIDDGPGRKTPIPGRFLAVASEKRQGPPVPPEKPAGRGGAAHDDFLGFSVFE
ncbi:hypothetical protein AY599_08885 [Leptolyngbya valderiana BDU 20041]|nr:hypothetical protein AY599_08885 [Leptolyngbya valderiana BDU 20041]